MAIRLLSPRRVIRTRPWAAGSSALFLLVSASFLLVLATEDRGWAVVGIVLAFLGIAATFMSLWRREGMSP